MKTRIILISSILASLCLLGCYTFPRKVGQWTGTIESARLYTWEGSGQDCVILVIETGPLFKDFKPKQAILVNTDGRCYMTNEVKAGKVRVDGLLTSGFPLSQQTGKPLVMHTNDQARTFEDRWLIKVKRLEPLP